MFDKQGYPLTEDIITNMKTFSNPTKAYLGVNNNVAEAAIENCLFDRFIDLKRHIINAMNPAYKKQVDANPPGSNCEDMLNSIRLETYKYEENEKKYRIKSKKCYLKKKHGRVNDEEFNVIFETECKGISEASIDPIPDTYYPLHWIAFISFGYGAAKISGQKTKHFPFFVQ